jgi:hypothetical protein
VTIPETVLTFVGAPLGIIIVITLAALGPSELRKPSRYRPGRPWTYKAAWFVPHPEPVVVDVRDHHEALPAAAARSALNPGGLDSYGTSAVGGASGEW